MVKRMLRLFLALLVLAVITDPSGAAARKPRSKPVPRTRPVKMFVGTFVNPEGRVHQIQIKDGGFLRIRNTKEGLFYRLYVRTGEDGTAEVTLKQYSDANYSVEMAADEMNVPLDSRLKRSWLAPFQFTLHGEQMALAKFRPAAAREKYIECCIDCGEGWEVCCGVWEEEPGWMTCCSIDTSCAWCEVCEWAY
ncbi:MAG TPA: hypothetical protein VGX68_08880 [Thermoanaerobaculia bacterium]|nr:hypothetical protein [Thermoanaerobaculia bacterium]